jgi:hypothetical protein
MKSNQPAFSRASGSQICRQCGQVFPGSSSAVSAAATIDPQTCPVCRATLAMAEPLPAPPPSKPECWYGDVAHRPASDQCPRRCNGAPVASEFFSRENRRFYCEAHWYWRRSDAPDARLQRL